MTMRSLRRREFLVETGLGIAGAAAMTSSTPALARAAGANGRLAVAVIGCGQMGTSHVRSLAKREDIDLVYTCDADESRAGQASDKAKTLGKSPKIVQDLRRVFDDNAVDAVWIATPDHWHGPAAILACQAGKHVYVEKPCSHNIREGSCNTFSVNSRVEARRVRPAPSSDTSGSSPNRR
jgi:Zn-dependent alcohol dehydrogenase